MKKVLRYLNDLSAANVIFMRLKNLFPVSTILKLRKWAVGSDGDMIIQKPCGVPGCASSSSYAFFTDKSENMQNPVRIFKCVQCQTGFHFKMPTTEQIDKMVDNPEQYCKSLYSYFLNQNLENPILNYELYDDINRKMLGWTKNKFNYVEGLKFLDFGCGPGFSFNVLNYFGWECYGVEANPWAIKLINKLYPTVQVVDNLKTLPSNTFSLIFMIHSIEHLIDPINILKELSRILKLGGELILHTPDSDDPDVENYYNPEHLFFFNEYSLKYYLQKVGLKPILVDRPPMSPPSIKIMAEKVNMLNENTQKFKGHTLIQPSKEETFFPIFRVFNEIIENVFLPFKPDINMPLYNECPIQFSYNCKIEGLRRVDFFIGTYERINQGQIIFQLYNINSSEILREVVINSHDLKDNEFATFTFLPIKMSKNTMFKFSLMLRNGKEEYFPGLWYERKTENNK